MNITIYIHGWLGYVSTCPGVIDGQAPQVSTLHTFANGLEREQIRMARC